MLPVMETGNRMSRSSRRDYLQRIYRRYQQGSRPEKQRILDEFCANCSYHRKHAIRLLNRPLPAAKPEPRRRARRRTYGPPMMAVLKAVWEAADYPWSVRLKALLPEWMPWIGRRFRLSAATEQQLLRISARTIDYRLRGEKRRRRRRLYGRTKPGSLLKHHIPLKTDHWDVKVPGFTEIDLVSHSGNSAAGDFCYSLNLTDIHTGWTETQAVLGKSQEAVRGALETIRQALPFALRGIDSDHGSEFINQHLYRYCQAQAMQFTAGGLTRKTTTRTSSRRTGRTCGACWATCVTTPRGRGRRSTICIATSCGGLRISFFPRGNWGTRGGAARGRGGVTKGLKPPWNPWRVAGRPT